MHIKGISIAKSRYIDKLAYFKTALFSKDIVCLYNMDLQI